MSKEQGGLPVWQHLATAKQCLVRSEALAAAWGCRSVAGHVDPENVPAVELYRRAGYRFVMKQSEWQRFVEGRATALSLMMRVLPNTGRSLPYILRRAARSSSYVMISIQLPQLFKS